MQRRGLADLKYGRPSVVGHLTATRLRGYVQAMVRTAFTVLLMVSLLGIAACGDDNGDEGRDDRRKTTGPRTSKLSGS